MSTQIDETTGLAENKGTLAHNISSVKTRIDNECGTFDYFKTHNYKTAKFYQFLTVNDDGNMHLVKGDAMKD